VRVGGLGKRWRGIVSVLAPVVIGVALAYGWSAANSKMATFRPPGAAARSAALAGHGWPGGSVDGIATTAEAPAPPVISHAVRSPAMDGAALRRPENVVKLDKNHKYHRKPRPYRHHGPRQTRTATRTVTRATVATPARAATRKGARAARRTATPRPVFSPGSRTIQAGGGVSGTPDRGRSIRLPHEKTSEATKGGGACGGLHRSNSCQADPGFARQPDPRGRGRA